MGRRYSSTDCGPCKWRNSNQSVSDWLIIAIGITALPKVRRVF